MNVNCQYIKFGLQCVIVAFPDHTHLLFQGKKLKFKFRGGQPAGPAGDVNHWQYQTTG